MTNKISGHPEHCGVAPLKVVLCWHMHQPDYKTSPDGAYREPWAYLHALKDYADMAGHLEANSHARAVVNFSPVLLEQLADYAEQLQAAVDAGEPIRDPVLRALQEPPRESSPEDARALLNACMRAHRARMVARFPAFERLHRLGEQSLADENYRYLNHAFYCDLAVWYHLAWMGETVRRSDFRVRLLEEKAAGFDAKDRAMLLEVIREVVAGILPRYRRLADAGQVELSVTPYGHPMLPLLIDWNSARESMPDVALPAGPGYPQGTERARWHLREARQVFERHFGRAPQGCWPSEGGVSQAALQLIGEAGFAWAASGQGVLRASLSALSGAEADGRDEADWLHRSLAVEGTDVRCFFRDDGLSDRIGFEYASWHADDAAADSVHHLENIAGAQNDGSERVVSIIMDGENAWETYPENGWHFLDGLYKTLVEHPAIELATFEQCLAASTAPYRLPRLSAGSWVYGTFSTWIGEAQKNRGWELLVAAAQAAQECLREDNLTARERARIEQQLAICEGSDWCWWFGEYNSAEAVHAFDVLYRAQLSALYRAMHLPPPPELADEFTHGGGHPEAGGTMRRGT